MTDTPRYLSVVRFKHNKYSEDDIKEYYFELIGKQFFFMGEIPNQPGHCVLLGIGPRVNDYLGKPEFFRHTDDFEEVPEEEL